MLILGVTSDDKGAQLEALVQATLIADGYQEIERNSIGAGGDELDVRAELRNQLMSREHIIPVICEAKAYGRPVTLPVWHQFLGKIFIQRAAVPGAIGVLIALNGVAGTVRGSHRGLGDPGLLIVDGRDLQQRATETGEISSDDEAQERIAATFSRQPTSTEVAYYGGSFIRVIRWADDSYSVLDGRAGLLSAERIEQLRPALDSSLRGELIPTAEALVRAEARHMERVRALGKILRGQALTIADLPAGYEELHAELADEAFIRDADGTLTAVPPDDLESDEIARFFQYLFQSSVRVSLLGFVADGLHRPYVARLIDAVPALRGGLDLGPEGIENLRAIAPLFPSIWLTIARDDGFFTHTNDAGESLEDDPRILEVDRNAFWERVISAMRSDFAHPQLRGFLFDYLHVVELEERREVIVKTRERIIGSASSETRDMIGLLADELAEQTGAQHLPIRVLGNVNQPWEMQHPEPVIELDDRPTPAPDGGG